MQPATRHLRIAASTAARLNGRMATSASARSRQFPSAGSGAGYYVPRIAVGGASVIGSLALYELASRAFGEPAVMEVAADAEWDSGWATSIDDALAKSRDAAAADSEGAAMLARGDALRTLSGARGGRRHVIFVRHAQPGEGAVEGNRATASTSSALSATGQKQAELTGRRLSSLFGNASAVYCSPSPEARATAEICSRHLGRATLIESPLLAEGVPIVPSPAPASLESIPGSEIGADMARAEGAFRTHVWPPSGEQQDASSVEVVVGHGNVIRYLVCRALQIHPVSWSRMAAHHGAITWLDIDCNGDVVLKEFGGVGHLSKDLVTYHQG